MAVTVATILEFLLDPFGPEELVLEPGLEEEGGDGCRCVPGGVELITSHVSHHVS
jgi:hypothetical protein